MRREISSSAYEKHRLKQADRLLSNKHIVISELPVNRQGSLAKFTADNLQHAPWCYVKVQVKVKVKVQVKVKVKVKVKGDIV